MYGCKERWISGYMNSQKVRKLDGYIEYELMDRKIVSKKNIYVDCKLNW